MSHVLVTNAKTGQTWMFPCHRWLGGKGPYQRKLPLAGTPGAHLDDVELDVQVFTSAFPGSGALAVPGVTAEMPEQHR